MANPFLAEIIMFGGNFAPRGWALCDGQLLPINQNQALFSLLGTIYGGDGRTTFALPDLRGRVPIHAGNGPGLTPRNLGSRGGGETETLNVTQIPAHTHSIAQPCNSAGDDDTDPIGKVMGNNGVEEIYANAQGIPANTQVMQSFNSAPAGGGQAHSNMEPFLAVNYLICLQGTFPSRN